MSSTELNAVKYCRLVISPPEENQDNVAEEDDFLVSRAHITEGLSRIPLARLEVYSGTGLKDYQELRKLLDCPAKLILSQTNGENRCIAGKVIQVEHLGLCRGNPKAQAVYHYRMVVASVVNDMHLVRHSRTFAQKTFQEIVQAVLDFYHISVIFRCTSPDRTDFYARKRNFYQHNESDYEFLCRVLFTAGWSYRIYTDDDGNGVQQEKILITDGNFFVDTGDDTEFQASANTEDLEQDINIRNWSMVDNIGIDFVEHTASAFDPEDKKGKRVWFMHPAGSLFAADSSDPMKKEHEEYRADSLKRFFEMNRQCCRGSASSVKLYPGCTVALNDFYGAGAGTVRSRITKLDIEVTDRLPEGYPVFTRPPQLTVKVEGVCIDDLETVPLFSGSESTDNRLTLSDDPGTSAESELPAASVSAPAAGDVKSSVFRAVVCTQDGDVSKKNDVCVMTADDNGSGMFFYALLDGSNDPVLVMFTMPIGGAGQGLYRLPRIGEAIVVMETGNNRFLLLAYIPSYESMPFVDKDKVGDSKQMTTLRHNVPGVAAGYFKNAADKPDPKMYKKFPFSEIGMYSNNGKESMRLQSVGARYDQTKDDHISTAANFLFSTPNNDDGEFHIANVKKINLQATESIRLQVGRNFIEIGEKNIEIRSRQTKACGGPQDSCLYLNPLGISGYGNSITMAGLKVGLSAALGEELNLNAGVASMVAPNIVVGTVDSNYLTMSQFLNAGMGVLNSVSFGCGIVDNAINNENFDSSVKDGKIQISNLEHMESSDIDFLSQFLAMINGATSIGISLANSITKMTCSQIADNKSDTASSVLAIFDVVMSGVITGLNLIKSPKAKAIAVDTVNFVFAEIKYTYYYKRAKSCNIEHHQISYLRMDSKTSEFWSKNIQVDTEKSEMKVYKFPTIMEKTAKPRSETEIAAIVRQNLPNVSDLAANLLQTGITSKTIKTAQELARKTARVKLDTAAQKISFEGPTMNSTSDKLKVKVNLNSNLNLGKKVKISAKDLRENITKIQTVATRLTLRATNKLAFDGANIDIDGITVKLNGTLIQLG